jgi:hypothetical protein
MSGFSPRPPPAVASATPSDPATTTSTSGAMMGLGASCTITPVRGSQVEFSFGGNYYNGTNTNSLLMTVRYGTGAAPANGAAPTGTVAGAISTTGGIFAVNTAIIFTLPRIATGLTPGTTYWFDIQVSVNVSGTAGFQNLNFNAVEV